MRLRRGRDAQDQVPKNTYPAANAKPVATPKAPGESVAAAPARAAALVDASQGVATQCTDAIGGF